MNCLDDEDLTRYIDDEMSKGERREFEGHLDSCHFCRHRLEENLKSERTLRHRLAGFSEAANRHPVSACDCASREHLVLYLKRGLTAEEAEGVERHLQLCDVCLAHLNLLVRIERWSALTPLQAVPESLVNLVQQGWRKSPGRSLDESQMESAVRLVIGLVARGLEVLSDSIIPPGITITPLGAAIPARAFRSLDEEASQDQTEALLFERQLEGSEVKVEVTVRKQKDDRIALISKLSKKTGPLANVRVSLLKDQFLLESRRTEPDGHAEFTILQPGKYLLRILSEAIEWPIEIRKP